MKIVGLMKLTLLDYPEKVACTVFLAGCNFRCPFCHNASLVRGGEQEISREELFAFLKKRSGVLDGVCITGGEPLMSDGAVELAREIKALGFSVKIDTNGSYPDRLAEILSAGLADYVAMDIKNTQEGYSLACGVEVDTEKIKRSVEIIKASGVPHEFRTTVVKGIHSAHDIAKAAAWVGEGESYYLQCYKESEDIINPDGLSAFTADELGEILSEAKRFNSKTELRGV